MIRNYFNHTDYQFHNFNSSNLHRSLSKSTTKNQKPYKNEDEKSLRLNSWKAFESNTVQIMIHAVKTGIQKRDIRNGLQNISINRNIFLEGRKCS